MGTVEFASVNTTEECRDMFKYINATDTNTGRNKQMKQCTFQAFDEFGLLFG